MLSTDDTPSTKLRGEHSEKLCWLTQNCLARVNTTGTFRSLCWWLPSFAWVLRACQFSCWIRLELGDGIFEPNEGKRSRPCRLASSQATGYVRAEDLKIVLLLSSLDKVLFCSHPEELQPSDEPLSSLWWVVHFENCGLAGGYMPIFVKPRHREGLIL